MRHVPLQDAVDDCLPLTVGVDKYGYILLPVTAVEQRKDVVDGAGGCPFLKGFRIGNFFSAEFLLCVFFWLSVFSNGYVAENSLVFRTHLLLHVGVESGHLEYICQEFEKLVVPRHNVVGAAPVGAALSVIVLQLTFREILAQLRMKQLRVGVAETVDALLYIANDEAVVPICQTVAHQRQQVFPLHARRVLKLVDEVVVDIHADALVDKRHLASADNAAHNVVGARQQDGVVVGGEFEYSSIDVAKQSQMVGIL